MPRRSTPTLTTNKTPRHANGAIAVQARAWTTQSATPPTNKIETNGGKCADIRTLFHHLASFSCGRAMYGARGRGDHMQRGPQHVAILAEESALQRYIYGICDMAHTLREHPGR